MTWLPLSQLDETEHSWRIQGNAVQFGGTGTYRKLRGCDPATFEVFAEPGCLIARDRNHVYHGTELLSAVQRDSFTHLGEGYWRDADAIYCEYETSLRPLKGSDAATFRHLGEGYAADRAQAYYGGIKIQSANPQALRLLHSLYAADDDTVFFDGKPLKGSDPQTWREAAGEAGKHSFSHDAKHVYYCEHKLPRADAATWQHLHNTLSKDGKHVYKTNRILPDANPAEWDAAKAAAHTAEEAARRAENSAKMSELLKNLWQNGQTD